MIEVQNLSRYYGRLRAVDDVSFAIDAHTCVGFLGLNGAGKTTTLKVIAGLLPPSAGTVKIQSPSYELERVVKDKYQECNDLDKDSTCWSRSGEFLVVYGGGFYRCR